jgi:hypothetical protein
MATSTGQAPFVVTMGTLVLAVGTAGNDDETIVGKVPITGTVSAVRYIPKGTLTGDNTNKRTFTLYNRGTAGAGTTKVAELDMVLAVDLATYVPKAITLSATAANLDVTAGEVLAFKSLHVASGVADPGGRIEVDIGRA